MFFTRWVCVVLFSGILEYFWKISFPTLWTVALHKKMKFSIKDFFSKCHQIHRFLRIWSHLMKESLMKKLHFFVQRCLLKKRASDFQKYISCLYIFRTCFFDDSFCWLLKQASIGFLFLQISLFTELKTKCLSVLLGIWMWQTFEIKFMYSLFLFLENLFIEIPIMKKNPRSLFLRFTSISRKSDGSIFDKVFKLLKSWVAIAFYKS